MIDRDDGYPTEAFYAEADPCESCGQAPALRGVREDVVGGRLPHRTARDRAEVERLQRDSIMPGASRGIRRVPMEVRVEAPPGHPGTD